MLKVGCLMGKFLPILRLKIYPESLRPKWSFVKSIPGYGPVEGEHLLVPGKDGRVQRVLGSIQ
jgi:hypothetical protein